MEFSEEIANKMLADPRWVGAITPKMVRVWKTRGTIPKQYFNPRFVELTKKNDPAANQVKDPYFNDKFILKMDLTDDEKKLHKRIVSIIFRNKKINGREILRQAGIAFHLAEDAARDEDDPRFVYLRPEHLLAIKKNLQELRIAIKNLVEKLQDKKQFWERDKKEIDELLGDKRLFIESLLENSKYRDRWSARKRGKMQLFEDVEAAWNIERLAIFLLETAM